MCDEALGHREGTTEARWEERSGENERDHREVKRKSERKKETDMLRGSERKLLFGKHARSLHLAS